MISLSDIRAELDKTPAGSACQVALEYLSAVDSTSSELKRRLGAGQLSGTTLLVTDDQTDGRGTHGRGWQQQAGRDLALSIALPETVAGLDDPRLPLAVGAAAALATEESAALPGAEVGWAGLRWPNDLCAGDPPLKFGGVLMERSAGWIIAGIGLNVNSTAGDLGPELSRFSTTLRDLGDAELDRDGFVAHFAAALVRHLGLAGAEQEGVPVEDLLAAWQARDRTAGKRYRLASSGELIFARSVDNATGALLCETEGGGAVTVRSYRELDAIPPV